MSQSVLRFAQVDGETEFRAGCCNSRFVLLLSTLINSVYVNVPYLLQQRRYNCARITIEIDGGDLIQGRRRRIDLNYCGPIHIRTLRQFCSGVDEGRCANAEKEIAGLSGGPCQREGLFGGDSPNHTTSGRKRPPQCLQRGGVSGSEDHSIAMRSQAKHLERPILPCNSNTSWLPAV
jgi:hypothetical protein